jgi:hypothetical protein
MATTVFQCFHHQNCRKRSRVDAKNPVFNRGMTYQMKEKGLIKVSIYFVGGVTMTELLMEEWETIAFVLVGMVSRAQLRDIVKTFKNVIF